MIQTISITVNPKTKQAQIRFEGMTAMDAAMVMGQLIVQIIAQATGAMSNLINIT